MEMYVNKRLTGKKEVNLRTKSRFGNWYAAMTCSKWAKTFKNTDEGFWIFVSLQLVCTYQTKGSHNTVIWASITPFNTHMAWWRCMTLRWRLIHNAAIFLGHDVRRILWEGDFLPLKSGAVRGLFFRRDERVKRRISCGERGGGGGGGVVGLKRRRSFLSETSEKLDLHSREK